MKDQKGFTVLISVLITSVIGTAIAVSLILLGLGTSRSSFVFEQASQAKALVDACAEEALEQINDSAPFEGSGGLSLGQGSCVYDVVKLLGQSRDIKATGTVGTVIRRVEISIDTITPQINIVSWQEVEDF